MIFNNIHKGLYKNNKCFILELTKKGKIFKYAVFYSININNFIFYCDNIIILKTIDNISKFNNKKCKLNKINMTKIEFNFNNDKISIEYKCGDIIITYNNDDDNAIISTIENKSID